MKMILDGYTWAQDYSTYDPSPVEFRGGNATANPFDVFPTVGELWELFWPIDLLCKIVCENKRYVGVMDALGKTIGGAIVGTHTLCHSIVLL